MLKYLLQGLLLGLAYVAPIGTQNLYVINAAIQKNKSKAYQVAFITIFFDISLAVACFFGLGFLISKFSIVKALILILGSLIVIYIGVRLILSTSGISEEVKIDDSLIKVIAACFAVTWLNPQAIIDGSLLLGGFRAALPYDMSKYFIFGVSSASLLWFTLLATVISTFKSSFNHNIIRFINVVCGTIIIFYGGKLGYSFIQMIR